MGRERGEESNKNVKMEKWKKKNGKEIIGPGDTHTKKIFFRLPILHPRNDISSTSGKKWAIT